MQATPEDPQQLAHQLTVCTWTASAMGALCESRLAELLGEPRSIAELAADCRSLTAVQIERCIAVVAQVGLVVAEGGRYRWAKAARHLAEPGRAVEFSGYVRTNLMQAQALLNAARGEKPALAWSHTEPALLQAQGDASSVLAQVIARELGPLLEGLGERLQQPGARCLDVGTGVGALAIALCREFPELQVVGIDRFDVALALARENVRAAQLEQRIELRSIPLAELRDRAAFDLIWFPTFFLAGAAALIPPLHAALRPGGWLLLGVQGAGASPWQRAVDALITELWGGTDLGPAQGEALLRAAGCSAVTVLNGPAWAPALVAGRR